MAVALTGIGLSAAPALAASACSADGTFCVSAITWSTPTVSNSAPHLITVTVQATPNLGQLLVDTEPGIFDNGSPIGRFFLDPVAGQPSAYTGQFETARGAKPGTWHPLWLIDQDRDATNAKFNAAGITPLTITGSVPADQTAPAVASLSLSSTGVQDVTYKAAEITVTARITDAGSGAGSVAVYATPRAKVAGNSPRNNVSSAILTRTAGTVSDGTWTGKLIIPGGTTNTYDLSVGTIDLLSNSATTSTAQLAAANLASSVITRTTAAPPALQGFSVTSGQIGTWPSFSVAAKASWTAQQAGKPIATEWAYTTSKGCGDTAGIAAAPPVWASRSPGAGVVTCTITVRAVNAAGTSATSSGSAVLF